MVFGGLQAFNLMSILLLVLPGLVGTKLYLREVNSGDRYRQLDRLETVVLSVAGSALGLLLVYLGYWLYFGLTSSREPWRAPLWTELQSHVDTLPELLFHYLLLIAAVVATGYVLGRRGLLIGQLPEARNRVWDAHLGAVSDGTDVSVWTTDGRCIVGNVADWGSDPREIVLKDPHRYDAESGDLSPLPGSRVIVCESSVARVHVGEPTGADHAALDDESDGDTIDRRR